MLLLVPIAVLYPLCQLILLFFSMLLLPLHILYYLLWKVLATVVGHMKDIEQREKEYREAKFFLDNTVRHINSFKLDNKEFYKSIAFEAVRLDVCEEVEKFMERIQHTELNIDNETPGEIFTREHANLLKEGEKWLKETAESCIITAALIVTIVFAAAITVPGGSNQETGIPLFRKQIAFTVFAISDAISLFSAATSLLVFLSIFLNARFAEKDFLLSLPRRLLIALGLLFLSATSMILAFSAILFLVFCDQRPWMLAPIGVCTCIPIAAIVTLQLPLVIKMLKLRASQEGLEEKMTDDEIMDKVLGSSRAFKPGRGRNLPKSTSSSSVCNYPSPEPLVSKSALRRFVEAHNQQMKDWHAQLADKNIELRLPAPLDPNALLEDDAEPRDVADVLEDAANVLEDAAEPGEELCKKRVHGLFLLLVCRFPAKHRNNMVVTPSQRLNGLCFYNNSIVPLVSHSVLLVRRNLSACPIATHPIAMKAVSHSVLLVRRNLSACPIATHPIAMKVVHQLGDANKVLNECTIVVMARMSNKLTRCDFSTCSSALPTTLPEENNNFISGDMREVDHGGVHSDKEAGCCSTHLIEGDGTFNAEGLDSFIKQVKM
ncbi:ankyrin repeat-containing protein [Tanacetum coccineum]